MTVSEALVKRINKYLEINGMTLYRFVKNSGIKPSTIKNLYRGHTRTPSLHLINQICENIDLDIHTFLHDDLGI